jgi:putative ABC transport system permease protein
VDVLEGRRGHANPGGRRQELFRPHRLHGHRCARPGDVWARLTGVTSPTTCRNGQSSPRSSPRRASVRSPSRHALTRFRETIAQNINYSVTIYVTLAVIIAWRGASQRAHPAVRACRELASLRVLGFTRGGVTRAPHRTHPAHLGRDPSWMIGYAWLAADQRFRATSIECPSLSKTQICQGGAQSCGDGGLRLIVRWCVDRLDLIAVLQTRDRSKPNALITDA